jgi:hypothetical protein
MSSLVLWSSKECAGLANGGSRIFRVPGERRLPVSPTVGSGHLCGIPHKCPYADYAIMWIWDTKQASVTVGERLAHISLSA